ncbi:MAG: glycosyltransferase family 9 protein [Acidobacteriia bacterium]|nr:glycosyltransferase family 9 protein [Terriglobia bacterium]
MIAPKKILICRWARLGDVILSEPATRQARAFFPDASISFLVDQRYDAIAQMMPSVDEVIPVDRIAWRDRNHLTSVVEIIRSTNALRRKQFDLFVDLQSFHESQLLALWSRARWRLAFKHPDRNHWGFCFNLPDVTEDKSLPLGEMFRQVVGSLSSSPLRPVIKDLPEDSSRGADFHEEMSPRSVPVLCVPASEDAAASELWSASGLKKVSRVFGMQISAPALARMWPLANYLDFAKRLIDVASRKGQSAGIACFADAKESSWCEQLRTLARSKGIPLLISFTGSLFSWAALMKRCTALVSNDTGPLHLSAAVGTPTLGLYGADYLDHYRPHGQNCRFLRKNALSDLAPQEVLETFLKMMDPAR